MKLDLGLDHGELPALVLDRQVFDDLLVTLGSDISRVTKVYRKFIEGTGARLDELRHQSVTDSAATFHALKGSAGMVGANRLAALAARLQDAAPGLDGETKAAAIGEIEAELAEFRQALSTQLGSSSPEQ